MKVTKTTTAAPARVWASWEASQRANGTLHIVKGAKGKMQAKSKKIPYEITDVEPGKSFSISIRSLLVRFIFSHEVEASFGGSKITYECKIKGPFGWFLRKLIGGQIQRNLELVLTTFVRQLEGR